MQNLFDINNIFFTIINYPMSYIEFFGTIFNIASVWLIARNKIINWPIGIIGTILFGALYWQINLYSDFLEQIYFLVTGFWGWWLWTQGKRTDDKNVSGITTLTKSQKINWFGITVVGTFVLGYLTSNLFVYFPNVFPAPASYAYLDSFTTVMSFVATIFMIKRKIECWYIWIAVDIIGIWLYWAKDVKLVSLLYVLFLIMATQGLFIWLKLKKN